MHFDIVHAADPRFYGGASSAVRVEIEAARKAGLSTALLPFLGVSDVRSRRFEPRLLESVQRLDIPWLTSDGPHECDILFAHNPLAFRHMPLQPVRLKPKVVVLSVQHPPFDGLGNVQYDHRAVRRNLERLFGAPVVFAPVGPKVRDQFHAVLEDGPDLLGHDLYNLVDLDEWPLRTGTAPSGKAVIGRHSRRDPLKWPDLETETRDAYPHAAHIDVRILGGVPDEIEPLIAPNWAIAPYANGGVAAFLQKLDFYVFFHSRKWVEAFGISIAEAMASGLVTLLDPSFESLFEDGAVYCTPAETSQVIARFLAAPAEYEAQSQAARRLVARKFSTQDYGARMRRLYRDLGLPVPIPLVDAPARAAGPGVAAAVTVPAGSVHGSRLAAAVKRRVLFVATNGIGLGHVTRLMAIADRMSADVEPVFLTMSAGSSIIAERGYPVDYVPSSRKAGVTPDSWNRIYAQELLAALEAFGAGTVVFDSNHPFPGLLDVMAVRRDLNWVWIRRGMWGPRHDLDASMQHRFDLVIEPGEFASDEDRGVTASLRTGVIRVAPILLVDHTDRMPREEAAIRLGVVPDRPIAVLQLGSEANFDVGPLRSAIIKALIELGIQVVDLVNPLADRKDAPVDGVVQTSVYPLARFFNAVDLLVTNAGYNTFHECINGCIPAVFVPNEAPEMDEQHVRAAYAQSAGLGLCLRTVDAAVAHRVIRQAFSSEFREQYQWRSSKLAAINGAQEAAMAIEELMFSVRSDRPLGTVIPRL